MLHSKLEYIAKMFINIFTHPYIKVAGGGVVAFFGFIFDSAREDALIAIFILCLFDFVTAIMAVRKTPNEMVESHKLWRTAGKLGIYFVLIASGRVSEIAMNNVIPILDETIIGFLAVTELISILENIGKMGYAVPKKLLKKLSDYRDDK